MTTPQPGGFDPSRTPGASPWQKPGGPNPNSIPGAAQPGPAPIQGYPAPANVPPAGYPPAGQGPQGPAPAPAVPAQPVASGQQSSAPSADQIPGVDRRGRVRRSRASYLWVGMIIAALVLIVLLIFIAQNSQKVSIHFLGFNGHLPFAVAVLIAAVAGLLLVAVPGSIRILELRKAVKQAAATIGNPGGQPAAERKRGRTSSR
jgi:uncharacterized integral membrane protein